MNLICFPYACALHRMEVRVIFGKCLLFSKFISRENMDQLFVSACCYFCLDMNIVIESVDLLPEHRRIGNVLK